MVLCIFNDRSFKSAVVPNPSIDQRHTTRFEIFSIVPCNENASPENKICGMTDSPLTEKGRAQARELGEKLRTSGLRIDEILYSPLSRAADTARAIAEATGIPARCEPRLREQCFGRYEGTPRDGEEFRISKTHFADRYSGGESMMQLAQRIYNLLDELRADTDKTDLLVAHNGIARVVQSYFYDMTNEEYERLMEQMQELNLDTFDE